jgi:ADP-ribosylglycohydrolase
LPLNQSLCPIYTGNEKNPQEKPMKPSDSAGCTSALTQVIFFVMVIHIPNPLTKGAHPMKDNATAMVLAAFAADALSLGAHWIYDTDLILATFNRLESFQKPGPNSYHPTKNVGEFTHYGDQMLVLLKSIAACRGFDLRHFAAQWQAHHQDYSGYIDRATRSTLASFSDGKGPDAAGSPSTDLGGAARIAPLAYVYANSLDDLLSSARMQTAMTHNNSMVVDSAAFFGAAVYRILHGQSPVAAIEETSASQFNREPFQTWVAKGIESRNANTIDTLKGFGQMCEISAAFPGVIHLVARYENDLRSALIENVMAGGDSAARGMITGMLLGAFNGPSAIAANWLEKLAAREIIIALLSDIGLPAS